jgi:hypothetical protein
VDTVLAKFRFRWIVWAAVILLSTVVVTPLVFADQTEASSAIASAKQEIVSCFEAAKEAEAVGANITSLTGVLNDAGLLLSNADLAFSKGDFDAARDLAVQSQGKLANFVPEANALKVATVQQGTTDFLINVVGSVAGTFVVLAAGAAVWFFLKKRYTERGERIDESPRA